MQFRTKARAVDLLGKGQIADLPTAITELWKNGYDAYADNLTAEIYLPGFMDLQTPLFVMTDDGKGMSHTDIFNNWLVLGTDSKSRATLEEGESIDTLWKEPRIKAGEKGIGRLSVAFLGSPMLMLTKKIGYPLQALFFDWRLLENYNLFLDDINIPVADVDQTRDFPLIFENLKNKFLENFSKDRDDDDKVIWEESQEKLKREIKLSISTIDLPSFFEERILNDIIKQDSAHGTKFIIFEPIDQIVDLYKSTEDTDNLEDKDFILSSLSGFTNDFIFTDKRIVKTSMPVHKEIGNDLDFLISQGNFFEYKDYEFADLIIDGHLTGDGIFKGNIKIYDEQIVFENNNPRKKDNRNNYGLVNLKLGYSQGVLEDSKLDEASYRKINEKVTKFGGLYIYRDKFRVLPYGRPNADFLNLEERRNRRIGTYFFSYRRMFGYIALTRDENPLLKDKSSREGLINNAQFRAFKSDLENLFVDLAKTYFSDKAKESIFLNKKSEFNDRAEAIKKDQGREIQEKKDFSKSLNEYPGKLEKFQKEYNDLIYNLDEKSKNADVLYSEIEQILDRLNTLDIEYKSLLPKIPKRYKPTDTQLDRLSKYEVQLNKFNNQIKAYREPVMNRVKEKLEIKELKNELIKTFQKYNANLERLIYTNRDALKERFDYLIRELSQRSKRIQDEFARDKNNILSGIISRHDTLSISEKIRSEFETSREQIEREISPIVNHIKRLSFDIDEELVQGAYKAEYDSIKYQWEQTRDVAQLGIAVEIIDHEFNQLYATLNNSLSKLSQDKHLENSPPFNLLLRNFKQLEDKYALLSPLYRISGVIAKSVSGRDLFEYMKSFFSSRLVDQSISFSATNNFLNHALIIKEPIIYTVLINVINNSFYWIRNAQTKEILFDYKSETDEILLMNSGEKIEDHRIEKIFDLFYSNRPNGRGIGLYLSKQSLNENYLDIIATNNKEYNSLNGACFIIKPLLKATK